MDIDIATYRVRIGTFNPRALNLKTKSTKPKRNSEKNFSIYNYLRSILYIILLSLITTNIMYCASNHSGNNKIYNVNQYTSKQNLFQQRNLNKYVPERLIKSVDPNFEAHYKFGNRNRGIKMIHWNAGSAHLENKFVEVESTIRDMRPHIFGISEANFKKNHDINRVQLEDYDLITCKTLNNPNLNISRLVVYKHRSLVTKVRYDLMSDEFSSIWLEVGFPGKKKFLVANIYREWQYMGQNDGGFSLTIPEQLRRWKIFLTQWEMALASGAECHVMGDINIDHLDINKLDTLETSSQTYKLITLIEELISRIYPHGVKQCVVGATHSWPGATDSLIDVLYTNTTRKITSVQTHHRGSDHKLVFCVRLARNIKNNVRYVKKRSYANFDKEAFLEEIRGLSWWDVYSCTNVHDAVQLLSDKITTALDKTAPIKTFQTRTKYAPWLSKETENLIARRNEAHKIASSTKRNEDWDCFKTLRNQINSRLRTEKKVWQQNKFDKYDHDSGKAWKNVLGWLGWTSGGAPTKLYSDGQIETSPSRMANIMNNFFINKVLTIRANLPPIISDPLKTLKKLMRNRTSTFSLTAVHPDEIKKIILGLKNSKSCGMDQIDTFIIKLVLDEILPAATHIVNLSLEAKEFPSSWKVAKVIPLLKKDDALDPKNYRPVAILPILSKVLERVVFNQIVTYMDNHKYIHPNHHGFRANHNTCTAMLQMYDSWIDAVENDKMAGVCMLDMSAAFDIVDHELLLQKFSLYGFDENALQWINSYLSGRSQCVYIDGALSSLLDVQVGVPQGSILGPLFYVCFTNDAPETVHEHGADIDVGHEFNTQCTECGGICCYADDSTYSVAHKDPVSLSAKLTNKYSVMADYMTDNRLKLNDDKTHLLVMTTRGRRLNRNTDVVIRTQTEPIVQSEVEKLLGCFVHQNLKWTEYIQNNENSLISSLKTRLNGLKKISYFASFKTRLMVANGIFISKLLYMIPLWGGCEGYLLNSLQVLQNNASRAVTKRGYYREGEPMTPVKDLLQQCGWLSVRQLVFYHSVIQVHKTLKTGFPEYLFEKLQSEKNYHTRIRATEDDTNVIHIGPQLRTKSDLTGKSFRWRASGQYNMIPENLRKTDKLAVFKNELKKWTWLNIPI